MANYVSNQLNPIKNTRVFLVLFLFLSFIITFSQLEKSFASSATTFTVINTNDSGAGSLRQAILDANASAGMDTIVFSIGSGVQTIKPLTPLPVITDPVILDGTTQPGYVDAPIIVIDGLDTVGTFAPGLQITAGNSTIKGLVINNFRNGSAVALSIFGGNTIQGNFIGTDHTGFLRRFNQYGIGIDCSNNLIGGTNPSERNLISGSTFSNIGIGGPGINNQIKGNFIGTNVQGTDALGTGGYGVEILNGNNTGNIVGGSEPGAGNLISGNGQYGIYASGDNTIIQGNLIGTDTTGSRIIPNRTGGITIAGQDILIGGTIPAARNIISGNNQHGISVIPFSSVLPAKIQGNYIGTDITGRASLKSDQFIGIVIRGVVIIGGTEINAGNVISGNKAIGIQLGSNGPGGSAATVQGNFIGTDATGTTALGNGSDAGILVSSDNNIIGGAEANAGNVISGNSVGIQIGGATTATIRNNTIYGNFIGTNKAGNLPLPNAKDGILISAGLNNKIGGSNQGEENLIAFNNGKGVFVSGSFDPAIGNLIRGNSMFMNGGLAIDLGTSGVAPNDSCDADTGANNLQNYPVLTSAFSNGTNTSITGSLNSTAGATFTVDFYLSPSYDSTNFGEGKIYIGSTNVTTAGNCNADFNVTLPYAAAGNQFITATATDSNGNTSEFSQFVLATGTSTKAKFDFDGDGKSDVSVFRPSTGGWYLLQSSKNSFAGQSLGVDGDIIAPADYDGDGKTDFAVFRPSNGNWYLQQSIAGFTAVQFGQNGDIPVPADYDGDGKADISVYRPSTGVWYRLNFSNGQFAAVRFGIAEDKPTIGDFDGDGKADIAVFRPSTGNWYRLNSSNNQFVAVQFGVAEDKPTPADFDGDGKTDIAVYRPSTGGWYRLNSSNGEFAAVGFGTAEDIPVPADYDGDNQDDVAVFRPSDGNWYVLRSTAGFAAVQFGQMNDKPVPNAFIQ